MDVGMASAARNDARQRGAVGELRERASVRIWRISGSSATTSPARAAGAASGGIAPEVRTDLLDAHRHRGAQLAAPARASPRPREADHGDDTPSTLATCGTRESCRARSCRAAAASMAKAPDRVEADCSRRERARVLAHARAQHVTRPRTPRKSRSTRTGPRVEVLELAEARRPVPGEM